jgi:hypothetical protein
VCGLKAVTVLGPFHLFKFNQLNSFLFFAFCHITAAGQLEKGGDMLRKTIGKKEAKKST